MISYVNAKGFPRRFPMKYKIIALVILLFLVGGCATYKYETESCFPYASYRGYRGPYCSPSP